MMIAYSVCALLFLNTIYFIQAAEVTWIPNTSFNLARNFLGKKLPCSKQTVIFPEFIMNSVELQLDTSVSGLVLPRDGELVLNNAVIEFGPDSDSNCTDGDIHYLDQTIPSWADAGVWQSPKFNEATPDAERIPCYDDVVIFPADSQFTITLPTEFQEVRGIRIGNKSYDTVEFSDYIASQVGEYQQFVFYDTEGVVVSEPQCKSIIGCPCQKVPPKIDCSVKFCQKPSCVYPIQPVGHCCRICGGFIMLDIDMSFDMISFKKLVETAVTSYGRENLAYHIGRLGDDKVQLVIVDKGDYSGLSAEVINAISHKVEGHRLQETLISGSPLYKSGLGGKLFVSMFFVVVAVMGSIYLYYYKLPIGFDMFSRPGLLSSYQRTESVVSLTRRDSIVVGNSSRAFRNPLYDSKRQRVSVGESETEE